MSKQTEADFQLLQAAAKAAGIAVRKSGGMLFVDVSKPSGVATGREWNPLADSADALHLAVRLGIAFSCRKGNAQAVTVGLGGFFIPFDEPVGADPMAATRRAIVRAAAAISEGEQK